MDGATSNSDTLALAGWMFSRDKLGPEVKDNTFEIRSGVIHGTVYGGFAQGASANNNTVSVVGNADLSDLFIKDPEPLSEDPGHWDYNFIYGGYSDGGSANNNTVLIDTTAKVGKSIAGGGANHMAVIADLNPDFTFDGPPSIEAILNFRLPDDWKDRRFDACNNTVEIRNADFQTFEDIDDFRDIVGGGAFHGNTDGNRVFLNVPADSYNVIGAINGDFNDLPWGEDFPELYWQPGDVMSASNNVVELTATSRANAVIGALADGTPGWVAKMNNNRVSIAGEVSVAYAVYRGFAIHQFDGVAQGQNVGNTLEISGTVRDSAAVLGIGIDIFDEKDRGTFKTPINASGNTLVIRKGANLENATVSLVNVEYVLQPEAYPMPVSLADEPVAVAAAAPAAETSRSTQEVTVVGTNNTLKLDAYQGTIGGLDMRGFDKMTVIVDSDADTSRPILTVNNLVAPNQPIEKIHLVADAQTQAKFAAAGTSIRIADEATLAKITIADKIVQVEDEDQLIESEGMINTDTGEITIVAPQATKKAKGYYEGLTAMLAVTAQSADLVAGSAMKSALDGIGMNATSGIAAMEGSSYRVQTGSSINVKGVSALAGVGHKTQLGAGALDMAGFVEFGYSSFDTDSVFDSSGSSKYYGLGVMTRWSADAGPFAEASLRFGRLDADFDGEKTIGKGNYEQTGTYWGGHVGLGWSFDLTSLGKAEVFGLYFYTHQSFDDMKVTGVATAMQANDAESSRTRLGARYNYGSGDWTSGVMLAWDHEFDGKTGGKIASVQVDAPNLSGNSAVMEAQFAYAPASSPWSLSARLGGYAGNRDGVYGSLGALYRF